MERRKTATKAFRFDTGLLERLKAMARRHSVSENALVEMILGRWLETEDLVRIFGRVELTKNALRAILETVDESKLEAAGLSLGKRDYLLASEMFESQGKTLVFQEYLGEALGRRSGWFKAEGDLAQSGRMVLYHGYGLGWSKFLKGCLAGAFSITSKDTIGFETNEDFLRIVLHPLEPQPSKQTWY